MTRSHDSGHGVPEQKHDRHFNKSGQGDIRGEAKKGGQGAHNWLVFAKIWEMGRGDVVIRF